MTKAQRAARAAAIYRAKRRAGICVRCDELAERGKSLCLEHKAARGAYIMERYRAMRAAYLDSHARGLARGI